MVYRHTVIGTTIQIVIVSVFQYHIIITCSISGNCNIILITQIYNLFINSGIQCNSFLNIIIYIYSHIINGSLKSVEIRVRIFMTYFYIRISRISLCSKCPIGTCNTIETIHIYSSLINSNIILLTRLKFLTVRFDNHCITFYSL